MTHSREYRVTMVEELCYHCHSGVSGNEKNLFQFLSTIFGPFWSRFGHYNYCRIMVMCAAERSGPKLQNEWSFVKIG